MMDKYMPIDRLAGLEHAANDAGFRIAILEKRVKELERELEQVKEQIRRKAETEQP